MNIYQLDVRKWFSFCLSTNGQTNKKTLTDCFQKRIMSASSEGVLIENPLIRLVGEQHIDVLYLLGLWQTDNKKSYATVECELFGTATETKRRIHDALFEADTTGIIPLTESCFSIVSYSLHDMFCGHGANTIEQKEFELATALTALKALFERRVSVIVDFVPGMFSKETNDLCVYKQAATSGQYEFVRLADDPERLKHMFYRDPVAATLTHGYSNAFSNTRTHTGSNVWGWFFDSHKTQLGNRLCQTMLADQACALVERVRLRTEDGAPVLIDGFRIDSAANLLFGTILTNTAMVAGACATVSKEYPLLREIRDRLRSIKPDLFLIAEAYWDYTCQDASRSLDAGTPAYTYTRWNVFEELVRRHTCNAVYWSETMNRLHALNAPQSSSVLGVPAVQRSHGTFGLDTEASTYRHTCTYLQNHDEGQFAVSHIGLDALFFASCIAYLCPGAALFGDGQFSCDSTHIPIQVAMYTANHRRNLVTHAAPEAFRMYRFFTSFRRHCSILNATDEYFAIYPVATSSAAYVVMRRYFLFILSADRCHAQGGSLRDVGFSDQDAQKRYRRVDISRLGRYPFTAPDDWNCIHNNRHLVGGDSTCIRDIVFSLPASNGFEIYIQV